MENKKAWKKPEKDPNSYLTGLKVSNTLQPEEPVEFIPKTGNRVTWYMCGPTVYDHSHLGHARTYISFDMIRRIMRDYLGYDVELVMNITNIDDKIIKRSNELGENFEDFAQKWENDYFEDMKSLNIERPNVITRVSEYLPEIISFIEKIIENGYAYESNGSVYFDVEKYKADTGRYGKLKCLCDDNETKELLKEGEGVLSAEDKEKRSELDFALWKKSKEGEPKWNSPWGNGRPGWHIECSAMANSILGSPIDVHSGGIDLRFPHHENEIAQSEAYYSSEQWVNYFIHSGHLNIDGLKMSKSLKNFITIKSMTKRYSPRQVRLLFATRRYDVLMDYHPTPEELGLDPSKQDVEKTPSMVQVIGMDKRIATFFQNIKAHLKENPITNPQKWSKPEFDLNVFFAEIKSKVHQQILDNFNIPDALKSLDKLITATNIYLNMENNKPKYPLLPSIANYMLDMYNNFGLDYNDSNKPNSKSLNSSSIEEEISPYIDAISMFRDEVRNAARSGDTKTVLKKCDEVRDEILVNLGIRLEDKSGGKSIWRFDDKEILLSEKKKREEEKSQKEEDLRQKEKEKQRNAEIAMKRAADLLERAKISPKDYFMSMTDKYSKFDEEGVPTHDASDVELSNQKKKQVRKEWAEQKANHEDWLKSQNM